MNLFGSGAELGIGYAYALAGLAGLMIGSFVNVVIHRLPLTLLHEDPNDDKAAQETGDGGGADGQEPNSAPPGLWSLVTPRSACVHCGQTIAWYDNIPLLSFFLLRRRCRSCRRPISWRYPLIEATAALLCLACVHRFGASLSAVVWAVLCLWLLAISVIDWQRLLIPDALSLSGMWLGLLLSCTGLIGISPQQSLLGAAAGYSFLFLIYWIYRLLTGKEGMGYGDFKLLAMLGAWLGLASLPGIVLIGSLSGSLWGIAQFLRTGEQSRPFAFGPWLALAALIIVLTPPPINILGLIS